MITNLQTGTVGAMVTDLPITTSKSAALKAKTKGQNFSSGGYYLNQPNSNQSELFHGALGNQNALT